MPRRPLDEDVAATALEWIRREELAAQTSFDKLLERTVALLSALRGPDAKSEWTDHSTQWSKPHCAAVGQAMSAFDASLRAQSLLYLAPVVEPLLQTGDATATVIADRSQFLSVVPSLTGALASLDLLASEDGSNALATRANAATAINRANCVDNEQNEIRKRTIEFNKALNRLLGADTSGRPQSDTVKGARTHMQKTLRAGLEAHAASLPPALVEAIRRHAGNESR